MLRHPADVIGMGRTRMEWTLTNGLVITDSTNLKVWILSAVSKRCFIVRSTQSAAAGKSDAVSDKRRHLDPSIETEKVVLVSWIELALNLAVTGVHRMLLTVKQIL
jgi:hypothetical protein